MSIQPDPSCQVCMESFGCESCKEIYSAIHYRAVCESCYLFGGIERSYFESDRCFSCTK